MSENKHTPEPWKYTPAETEFDVGKEYPITGANIDGTDGSIFRIDLGDFSGLDDANARRIVACVNACVGIKTSTLEYLLELNRPIDKFFRN